MENNENEKNFKELGSKKLEASAGKVNPQQGGPKNTKNQPK